MWQKISIIEKLEKQHMLEHVDNAKNIRGKNEETILEHAENVNNYFSNKRNLLHI